MTCWFEINLLLIWIVLNSELLPGEFVDAGLLKPDGALRSKINIKHQTNCYLFL